MRAVEAVLALFVSVSLVMVASACSESPRSSVVVMTPASLAESFMALEADFEAAYPAYDVEINLAGTSALREQVLAGAPGDVFVSANETIMDQLLEADAVSSPTTMMTTELRIAFPRENPGSITGLSDFANEDLLIGLCAEGVPCGDYARELFRQAGIEPAVDTNERDVRALLAKLEAGELDAGIVYVSEIRATDEVEGLWVPLLGDFQVRYPIAVLTEAPNPAGAKAFVDFALSGDTQLRLAEFGFSGP